MFTFLRFNSFAIFSAVALPWLISTFVTFGNNEYDMYVSLFAYTMLLIWFLGLDSELSKRIPLKIRPSNTLFLINLALLYLGYCSLRVFLEPGTSFNVTGLAAIPFLYVFYAWFSIFDHLSKLLTYSEEEKQLPTGRRIGEMVLFIFFFVGLWWLQPRIRKILEKEEIHPENYVVSS
jgi:hypothetical protein